jgi:hypothetical protein
MVPAKQILQGSFIRRVGLAVLAIAAVALSTAMVLQLASYFPFGIDLRIPLHAAERFSSGQSPYVGGELRLGGGNGLPFLYPPAVLPFFVLVSSFPVAVLFPVWAVLSIGAALFAITRLGVPLRLAALTLVWPPFFEGLITLNVQVLLFAAYVGLFWVGVKSGRSVPRDFREGDLRDDARIGLLATIVGSIKVSQLLPWIFLLRRRPRAAAIGGVAAAGVAVALLPVTGVSVWGDWLAQLLQQSSPEKLAIGFPMSVFIGAGPGAAVTILAIVGALVIRTDVGAWIGLLLIVGSPTVHTYTFLFAIPAMLLIRREFGLFAAILVATYNPVFEWIGVLFAAWTLAASRVWPLFREPDRTSAGTVRIRRQEARRATST